MKVAYLSAGAAGRFCGTCLHDNTLAVALGKLGAEILLIPTYTPLRTDEPSVSQSRVFFGGVNVYLQEHSAIFRHTPWFLDSLLDSPRLLDWLSRRSAGMNVKDLGPLTVSSLRGEKGRQRKELKKLIGWLKREVRPDVIHLSNVLLAGLAPTLREQLGAPVVCNLSGEDIFLEQITEPHYSEARQLLKQQSAAVDRFIALNNYFADFMADYLATPRERVEVIPHGLNLADHLPRTEIATSEAQTTGFREDAAKPVTIGYFARIAAEKGLHILVEAFCRLAKRPDLPPLRLKVAGYMSSADMPYFEHSREQIVAAGLSDRFEYAGELDRPGKIAFLQSIDIASVPTVYHESKGISVLETLATAVPVVLPRHGTFPELIEASGGGLLCEPLDPQSLADALERLVRDPALADRCGRNGLAYIRAEHTAAKMAERHLHLYRRLTGEPDVTAIPALV